MKNPQALVKRLTNFLKPLLFLALFVLGSNTNPIFAQNWNEIIKTVPSDRNTSDNFGVSVAISGNYAIVGARFEDEDTTGGNYLFNAGSAYILKNNAGTWSEVQKLVASDRGVGDFFGESVAISGDYAIVGAWYEDHDTTGGNSLSNAGSVYIFKNNSGTWSEVQKLVASDRGTLDFFGKSVAISGNYAIVGAFLEDHDTTGGNFLTGAGAAYIFKNNAGTWSEVQKIVASDRGSDDIFGVSVAISDEYAIVGASLESQDTAGLNTLSNAGSAYIFENNSGTWSEVQKIVASDRGINDGFGAAIAISGETAIVGARFEDEDITGQNTLSHAGSAYIFKNDSGSWSEVQKIVASDRDFDDSFGVSVSISGNYAIIGAYWEEEDITGGNNLNSAGSAYIFKNKAGNWSEVQKVVASDRGAGDVFGWSVAISGDYAIVGSPSEDEDTTGGNTLNAAGSAYIFNNCSTSGIDVQTACDSLIWIDSITYTASNNTATHILTNAAGCDSIVTLDLTINYSSTSNDTVTACDRYTWNASNITYTNSGTYMDTMTNATGCDSVLTLELTIDSVTDLSTTTAGLTITANNANATYQWLDCGSNNTIIAGETGQTYTATSNGNYAVELTENGCIDTSACVQILTVGIKKNSLGHASFKINPNPSQGMLFIEIDQADQNTPLVVYNQVGQVVKEAKLVNGRNQIDLVGQAKGVYFVRYGEITEKIILVE